MSFREAQVYVLRLLADGQRMKEIAEALGISVRTVETYLPASCSSSASIICPGW
jgi:DNA-binding NarL/FixJ family response regulator